MLELQPPIHLCPDNVCDTGVPQELQLVGIDTNKSQKMPNMHIFLDPCREFKKCAL